MMLFIASGSAEYKHFVEHTITKLLFKYVLQLEIGIFMVINSSLNNYIKYMRQRKTLHNILHNCECTIAQFTDLYICFEVYLAYEYDSYVS